MIIFGFHNVESQSDERQVGGTDNGTCGDQKSGLTQGMIFHPDFARVSPVHIPVPRLFLVTLSK